MEKFWCERPKCLAIDDFKSSVVVEGQIVLIRPNFPRVIKDCVHENRYFLLLK
jgi:hypothetical protein